MANLMKALMVSTPVQVFDEHLDEANRRWRQLAKLCHPDTGGSDELFQRLDSMWIAYQNAYDTSLDTELMLGSGDISNVTYLGANMVIKSVINSDVMDMLNHEMIVLNSLQYMNNRTDSYYPMPVEVAKDCLVYTYSEANALRLYSLKSITEYYGGQIPERHLGWIWRKLLVAMDYAHSLGIIHSSITPDNILIHPYVHGVVLIDWIHASINQAPITSISMRNESFYPPERYDKDPPTPGWDIYMAARCMMNSFSPMCYELDRYFSILADPNFRARVSDFKTLKDTFDDVIFNLLGWKREFIVMDFPDWDQL